MDNEQKTGEVKVDGPTPAVDESVPVAEEGVAPAATEEPAPVAEEEVAPVAEEVAPIEETATAPAGPQKFYMEKQVMAEGTRTVNGIEYRHLTLIDGSQCDLTNEQYEESVVVKEA